MKKILININNHTMTFSYKRNTSYTDNDLINTNMITNNELIFSDKYIEENLKILTTFMKEIALQYNVNKIIISKIELAPLIINLVNKCTEIKECCIKEEDTISYGVCEALINNKNIKHLNCDSIQPFMIDLLDKHGITCESTSEILYSSQFMEQNNLKFYSNIYYKTNVRVTLPLSLEDLKDFEDFCKINRYLKTIHINKLINTELEKIIKILVRHSMRNIKVVIHENVNDEKTVNNLKEINKKYKKDYKIMLSLEYTKEYLDQNIFKQTIVNTLKVSGLIISSLVVLVITYIGISNYVALKQVDSIKKDLAAVIENTNTDKIIEEKNKENLEKAKEEKEETEKIKPVTNTALAALLSVNEDVVGELKVNNTNVDYPVVQAGDNDYYLHRNINKEKNANGWVFLDYRNNTMFLDRNNIIYGHNMYYSGVMFGTLYKTANKSWYENPDNQIITYNTLYEDMKFRIFSIYKIPKTSDYIQVYFENDLKFIEFIDMVTERSIYDFNVPVGPNDKILTLSTCSDNGLKRLVIHAVLMENENKANELN